MISLLLDDVLFYIFHVTQIAARKPVDNAVYCTGRTNFPIDFKSVLIRQIRRNPGCDLLKQTVKIVSILLHSLLPANRLAEGCHLVVR